MHLLVYLSRLNLFLLIFMYLLIKDVGFSPNHPSEWGILFAFTTTAIKRSVVLIYCL